jgi:hypothetical protein
VADTDGRPLQASRGGELITYDAASDQLQILKEGMVALGTYKLYIEATSVGEARGYKAVNVTLTKYAN